MTLLRWVALAPVLLVLGVFWQGIVGGAPWLATAVIVSLTAAAAVLPVRNREQRVRRWLIDRYGLLDETVRHPATPIDLNGPAHVKLREAARNQDVDTRRYLPHPVLSGAFATAPLMAVIALWVAPINPLPGGDPTVPEPVPENLLARDRPNASGSAETPEGATNDAADPPTDANDVVPQRPERSEDAKQDENLTTEPANQPDAPPQDQAASEGEASRQDVNTGSEAADEAGEADPRLNSESQTVDFPADQPSEGAPESGNESTIPPAASREPQEDTTSGGLTDEDSDVEPSEASSAPSGEDDANGATQTQDRDGRNAEAVEPTSAGEGVTNRETRTQDQDERNFETVETASERRGDMQATSQDEQASDAVVTEEASNGVTPRDGSRTVRPRDASTDAETDGTTSVERFSTPIEAGAEEGPETDRNLTAGAANPEDINRDATPQPNAAPSTETQPANENTVIGAPQSNTPNTAPTPHQGERTPSNPTVNGAAQSTPADNSNEAPQNDVPPTPPADDPPVLPQDRQTVERYFSDDATP